MTHISTGFTSSGHDSSRCRADAAGRIPHSERCRRRNACCRVRSFICAPRGVNGTQVEAQQRHRRPVVAAIGSRSNRQQPQRPMARCDLHAAQQL